MKILDKDWKIITAYYVCYNAFYALLMKIGIKCEIHDCSIELINLFNSFEEKDYNFIKNLKDNRIDVQYYLKKPEDIEENDVIVFVEKCKLILDSLNNFEVEKITELIKTFEKEG